MPQSTFEPPESQTESSSKSIIINNYSINKNLITTMQLYSTLAQVVLTFFNEFSKQ